jgi:DNA-binding NarL/FixJ family response regulator
MSLDTLHLTRREKEVLRHIVEGHSIPEIGKLLYLSPRTVEKYRDSILRKLSTDDTGGAEPCGGVRVPTTPLPYDGGTMAAEELSDHLRSIHPDPTPRSHPH